MDAETLFAKLEFNTGEFPEKVLNAAVEQRTSIVPMLLDELRCAAADPESLLNKDESYVRHMYAIYLLAQFREEAAYPLIVDFVATPGEVVMDLMEDVITEDLGRILASVCHGDIGPIQRLIEDPQINEWVRSAALDTVLHLFVAGQLTHEQVMDYLKELFTHKIERKPSYVWSEMESVARDLHPEELEEEIRRAYAEGLIDPDYVRLSEVESSLNEEKEERLEDLRKYKKGLIGNVVDELRSWACFNGRDSESLQSERSLEFDENQWPPLVDTVVRSTPKVGRNEPCPCGSGKKYKKCCLGKD